VTRAAASEPSVGPHPPGVFGAIEAWAVAVAVVVRLGVWLAVPASRFASDEAPYFRAGLGLLLRGEQNLSWPPVTGWLIAASAGTLGTTAVGWIRLVWIALDVGAVLAVRALAGRVAPIVAQGDRALAARFTGLATLAYALYLPAISFAQFTTSETPAVVQTLVILLLLSRPRSSWRVFATAGLLAGTLALTRPSLLPLLVVLPATALLPTPAPGRLRQASIFVVAALVVVGGMLVRNWWTVGEWTVSRNSAYNLYIGNRDLYAEDLNLFSPRATTAQIEFRRQYFSGQLPRPSEPPAELQRQALAWIADHPGEFARRALGRLARVFAPKTDVLELLGGEPQAGIFRPGSLALLAAANVQWALVLFGGMIGLGRIWRENRLLGSLLVGAVLGSLPLCLVAIAKPRYAFVFEPILLLGAAVFAAGPRQAWNGLGRAGRWVVGLSSAFIVWAWVAWFVFSLSSRLTLP
jgi:hypothetical protein